jgi:hypothetical protein
MSSCEVRRHEMFKIFQVYTFFIGLIRKILCNFYETLLQNTFMREEEKVRAHIKKKAKKKRKEICFFFLK